MTLLVYKLLLHYLLPFDSKAIALQKGVTTLYILNF